LVTVRAFGEVDTFTGRTLEDALTAALAMEATQLRVDLTAVTYFSASSVSILYRARRQASESDELEVVARPGIVQRVVAHFDRLATGA
jgi:anti-anti-sigma factor